MPIPRVYNSRDGGQPKRGDGEERTVALAPGIPAAANAAVINLTVTETVAAGYVAVFPANVAWPGNSSINWSDPIQNIANTAITGIDPSSQIKIRGGANPTHVIIDVLGWLGP
jgi:hypothetical protein